MPVKSTTLGVLLVAAAPLAFGLNERWHCDIHAAARSLPAVADRLGDGRPEVVFTTRYDGAVWAVSHAGEMLRHYTYEHWLEGGIAATTHAGSRGAVFAFQESDGRLNLCDYRLGTTLSIRVDGKPCIGTMPCFADLDGVVPRR